MSLVSLAELGALFLTGQKLREAGLLRNSDGETAFKLATYLTLPSVALQSLCTQGPVPHEAWLGAGVAAVCYATQAASNWIYCMAKPKQERAAILGSGTGLSLTMIGFPVGEALFGVSGLQPLVLLDALNRVAVCVGSYLLFASAGPAFPESFKHEDGGVYRGQWKGMRKEGLGVYTYLSGARYEGEWRDNLKDGRGVYFFPKGGTYEGEWSQGTMEGVGVRTFSTGQVKCGRWKAGKLEEPLELWQCTNAAEGAAEAMGAARRVEVGGGQLPDALRQLLRVPSLWVVLAGLALSATGQKLPTALDAVTTCLAPIHRPLMMLAAGLTLSFELPPPAMVGLLRRRVLPLRTEAARLARRLGVRCPCCACAAAVRLPTQTLGLASLVPFLPIARPPFLPIARPPLLPIACPPFLPIACLVHCVRMQAGQVAQLVAARFIIPIFVCSACLGVAGGTADAPAAAALATVLLAFLTPIPPQALAYTRTFRLNERLTATLTSASNLASLPLLCLLGVAAWASRLFAIPPPPPAPALAGPPSVLPLLAFCVGAAAALGVCVVHAKRGSMQAKAPVAAAPAGPGAGGGAPAGSMAGDQRVLMVYQGTPEARARAAGTQLPTGSSGSGSQGARVVGRKAGEGVQGAGGSGGAAAGAAAASSQGAGAEGGVSGRAEGRSVVGGSGGREEGQEEGSTSRDQGFARASTQPSPSSPPALAADATPDLGPSTSASQQQRGRAESGSSSSTSGGSGKSSGSSSLSQQQQLQQQSSSSTMTPTEGSVAAEGPPEMDKGADRKDGDSGGPSSSSSSTSLHAWHPSHATPSPVSSLCPSLPLSCRKLYGAVPGTLSWPRSYSSSSSSSSARLRGLNRPCTIISQQSGLKSVQQGSHRLRTPSWAAAIQPTGSISFGFCKF